MSWIRVVAHAIVDRGARLEEDSEAVATAVAPASAREHGQAKAD